ncbi:Pkinase-domain-containing protein [Lentinus tigrinus ALCF2SS1-7]|uniref:Pkinase-domain-containing protein n=1 Tax=Lentinus tigrinus ALCF2SS1-6 TaxID=1328759 RepID=A0A5C2SP96_9APHY|nr:Pkinase-domain-containing protein [Lentinus tigrinus ALCF2SS1-6]RPD79002.1 Pkinase-domain-containing protein [Lentinus tigrinus ALCF2SS1-7]
MSNIGNVLLDLSLRWLDSGRYQLITPIGAGACGVVYRASERIPHASHFVTRAIKVVHRGHPKSEEEYHQALEAALHRMVSGHKNIVRLRRVVRDSCFFYFIMDYYPGGDLFRAIRKGAFARDDALVKQVFLQLLDGVEAAHANGVFHRDLKPENVLVNEDCTRVWIADFGLATQRRQSTTFNTGTRCFMSPECINGGDESHPYDTRRNDMWALGLILISLVTDRLPWHEATRENPDLRAYFEDPEFLRGLLPISTALDNLIRRVLTMVPEDCISLEEFRTCIRDIETFWMSEEEVAASGETVQYVWDSYRPVQDVQLPLQMQAPTIDDDETAGDVLESGISSGSAIFWDADSDDWDERVTFKYNSGDYTRVRALVQVEEARAPEPVASTVPPNSLELPPQPETETKAAVLCLPAPRTTSSIEFPLRRPPLRHVRKESVPQQYSTLDSVLPVAPPMRPQVPPKAVVAASLEDEVLQVERAVVAKLAEPVPSVHEKITKFFRSIVARRPLWRAAYRQRIVASRLFHGRMGGKGFAKSVVAAGV